MNAFETTATANDHGQIHLAGVPFASGTEVEIAIWPKTPSTEKSSPLEQAMPAVPANDLDDIFAEMQPYEAQGNTEVDDSREAIYTPLEGE